MNDDGVFRSRADALERAREAVRSARASGSLRRRDPVEKLRLRPTSLRLAINAKCWDCAGGSRTEISRCVVTGCPLWNVRPYQRDDGHDSDDESDLEA